MKGASGGSNAAAFPRWSERRCCRRRSRLGSLIVAVGRGVLGHRSADVIWLLFSSATLGIEFSRPPL
eukprot:472689-Pyramimonas_sp.AAC.1